MFEKREMSFIEFQRKFEQKIFPISAEKFKLTLHYVKVAVNISYAFAHKQFYIINSCSGYFAPAYFMENKNKNYLRISCIQRRHWVSLWNFCQVDWRFEWLLFFVFEWKFLVFVSVLMCFIYAHQKEVIAHTRLSTLIHCLIFVTCVDGSFKRNLYSPSKATERLFNFIYQHHLRQCNKNVMKILLHIT